MSSTDILNKLDEFRALVARDQMERATSRMLDLLPAVGVHLSKIADYREIRNKALLLSARVTKLIEERRRLGESAETERTLRVIEYDFLMFIDHLEDEVKIAHSASSLHNANAPMSSDISDRQPQFVEARHSHRLSRENQLRSRQRIGDVALEVNNLVFSRSAFVLSVEELSLSSGEMMAVVGQNGSGKTTLLNIIANRLQSDSGTTRIGYLPSTASHYSIKASMSYISQHLEPWRGSLADNLRFEAAINGKRGERNEEEVEFVIHRLRLERYVSHKWHELSAGYQTRFELARALLREPYVVIMDEPLAHLDFRAQEQFLQDIRDITSASSRAIATIISSQHLPEVEKFCDRFMVLNEGRVLFSGQREEIIKLFASRCFEVSCSLAREELSRALASLNVTIEEGVVSWIIMTPGHVLGRDILRCLVESGADVDVFRDVTNSTRRFFFVRA